MKTNIIPKSTIAIIAIIIGILVPLNNHAQVPTPEEIKQQVKENLGNSPRISNRTIGHCPNCGCTELSHYTDIETVNNRRVITDEGVKCNCGQCNWKMSKRHTCKIYTPEEYERGIRRCVLVERIPINGNPSMETLVLSNNCWTHNEFECTIINGDRIVFRNIIIKPGESFRKDLPKDCRIVVRKKPAQRGDSRTRQ